MNPLFQKFLDPALALRRMIIVCEQLSVDLNVNGREEAAPDGQGLAQDGDEGNRRRRRWDGERVVCEVQVALLLLCLRLRCLGHRIRITLRGQNCRTDRCPPSITPRFRPDWLVVYLLLLQEQRGETLETRFSTVIN